MTLVLWPAIRRADIRLRWNFDLHNPAVRAVAQLSGWTLGSVVANQIALFVTLALLNGDKGSVSAYTYAFIFFQLPFGLLAVSIMTTFMPELASAAGRGDLVAFRRRFGQGLRLIVLVILPAAVGYVLLARPIIAVLLQHGRLGSGAATLTAEALVWLAVGLPGYAVFLFALRGFYALKDTRTPFVLYLVENGVNVVLAFALVGRFGLRGIIAAYSLAYSVSAVVALVLLARRTGGMETRSLLASTGRTVAAGAVLAAAVWPVRQVVGGTSGAGAVARVAAGTLVGVAAYGIALWVLRSPDLAWVQGRLSRRSRRQG
jgi:putative peptidoglycan lipid II flippase